MLILNHTLLFFPGNKQDMLAAARSIAHLTGFLNIFETDIAVRSLKEKKKNQSLS